MVNAVKTLVAATLATLALADLSAAHQERERSPVEVQARRLLAANAKHAIGECQQTEGWRKLQERAALRRQETLHRARRERRLAAAADYTSVDHQSSLDVSASTASSTFFGDEVSCVLEPELTEGPFYVEGEYIRQDIREDQPGFDMYFDMQVVDVNTCEPVDNIYMHLWHVNVSGIYSGVVDSDNGNGDDLTNINNTALRGIYPTNSDGVVQFLTKFPGHYSDRATHMHILGSSDGTVFDNGTYWGGDISHIGQFFFDQDLLTEVYETETYAINTNTILLNTQDSILSQASAAGYDSIVEYALLGDSVEDGLFAWISVGVNMSFSTTVTAAAELTANGGVSLEDGSAYESEFGAIGGDAIGGGGFGSDMGFGSGMGFGSVMGAVDESA